MMLNLPFIRSEVQKFGAHLRDLREKRERALRRREELKTLPMSKEDLLALIERWIDGYAAEYPAALACALQNIADQHGKIIGADHRLSLSLLTAVGHVGTTGAPEHIQKGLFFFFAAEFKAGVRRAIDAMPNKTCGPRMADREKELARLDAEIPRLELEIAELVKEAEGAGLAVDYSTSDFSKKSAS